MEDGTLPECDPRTARGSDRSGLDWPGRDWPGGATPAARVWPRRPAMHRPAPDAGAEVFPDERSEAPDAELPRAAAPMALLRLARATPAAWRPAEAARAGARLAPAPGAIPGTEARGRATPAAESGGLVGLAPGALVETADGRVPVEELAPGDRLITRDRGLQPLRWVGVSTMAVGALAFRPQLAPVRIARGALGGGLPERDLVLAPDQRLMLRMGQARALFGCAEVTVAAGDLADLAARPGIGRIAPVRSGDGATRDGEDSGRQVRFVQLLQGDGEGLIRVEGVWCETFRPCARRLAALSLEDRATLSALQPAATDDRGPLSGPGPRRPALSRTEARTLLAA